VSLVKVAFPESPSELAMVVCLLEANDIPHFVHNAGFGSLYPGPQIALYNNITVMVPSPVADDAIEVLSVLSEPSTTYPSSNTLLMDKIRMVIEAILFGWFIPRRK
jgi:hypothetical protein